MGSTMAFHKTSDADELCKNVFLAQHLSVQHDPM